MFKGVNVLVRTNMGKSRHFKIGVFLSLSFLGCVLWAIVETVAKTDNKWVIRFNVAMGCIGLDVLVCSWFIVRHVIENCTNSVNTHHRPEVTDNATPAHLTVTQRIPPLFMVEILVDVDNDADENDCEIVDQNESKIERENDRESENIIDSEIEVEIKTQMRAIEVGSFCREKEKSRPDV